MRFYKSLIFNLLFSQWEEKEKQPLERQVKEDGTVNKLLEKKLNEPRAWRDMVFHCSVDRSSVSQVACKL